MNFKNITKIAAAIALLFASTSIFGQGPLYLHIQNDTAYNFNLTQIREKNRAYALFTINSGSPAYISQIQWSYDLETVANGIFNITATKDNKIELRLKAAYIKSENKFRAMLNWGAKGTIAETEKPVTSINNEFHVFLTLAGNKENDFSGSSIRVEAGESKA